MEFKSIKITDFLSYYGENVIEFSPMTTIIIGQNNTGKSKLFDAINFVLYGRIFQTDKDKDGEWITDEKEVASIVLNWRRKKDALEKNEENVNVSVELKMDTGNSLLIINREFQLKKNNLEYEYATNTFSFSELDKLDGHPIHNDIGAIAKDRLRIYFTDEVKDFFLFQGEAASKIMQLQDGGNFKTAVRTITHLSDFETAVGFSQDYLSNVQNRMTRKTKLKTLYNSLVTEKEDKENRKKQFEDKKNKALKNVNDCSSKIDELEKELASYKEFEEWLKQKTIFEQNRKKIETELKSIEREKLEIAQDSVFYKVLNKISSFKDFYSVLEERGIVPPSIPADEIRKALKTCRCPICNSDLSEGTVGRKFAENRLPKCDIDSLGRYLQDLNITFGNEVEDILRIPDDFNDILQRKREAEIKRKSLVDEKEKIDRMLFSVSLNEQEAEEKKKHIDDIRNSLSRYTSLCEEAKAYVNINNGHIVELQEQLDKINSKLIGMVKVDPNFKPEERILSFYSEKLQKAMTRLKENVQKTAYGTVQDRANEYYKEMTKNNAAIVGSIKIDMKNSCIYTVDEEGNKIQNINQGNRISIQLAVIAGILSVATKEFNQQYTFVTDAPVSALGGDNKLSTIETMINAFEQSIIIIKDDTSTKNKADDEIRKFIMNNPDIGIAYELSLSKEDNIKEQHTVFSRIKG